MGVKRKEVDRPGDPLAVIARAPMAAAPAGLVPSQAAARLRVWAKRGLQGRAVLARLAMDASIDGPRRRGSRRGCRGRRRARPTERGRQTMDAVSVPREHAAPRPSRPLPRPALTLLFVAIHRSLLPAALLLAALLLGTSQPPLGLSRPFLFPSSCPLPRYPFLPAPSISFPVNKGLWKGRGVPLLPLLEREAVCSWTLSGSPWEHLENPRDS